MNKPIKLTKKMREAARWAAAGFPPERIASRVGLTKADVQVILQDEAVQQLIAAFRESSPEELAEWTGEVVAQQILESAAPRAAERVVELVDEADKDETSLRASEAVLDRTGHAKRTEIRTTTVLIEADMAKLIEETRRMALDAIPEAEFELIEDEELNGEPREQDEDLREPGRSGDPV